MDSALSSSKKTVEPIPCEVSDIWHVLGKAWALIILKNMSTKKLIRFNDLKRILPGISNTVLSSRLKDLERANLISKKVYAEVPLRVEYNLTRQAKELDNILEILGKWASNWKPIPIRQK